MTDLPECAWSRVKTLEQIGQTVLPRSYRLTLWLLPVFETCENSNLPNKFHMGGDLLYHSIGRDSHKFNLASHNVPVKHLNATNRKPACDVQRRPSLAAKTTWSWAIRLFQFTGLRKSQTPLKSLVTPGTRHSDFTYHLR